MLNIKTIMLVTGLTSLTCQPQAWAMDDLDNPSTAGSAHLPISPEHELEISQEPSLDVSTQLQREQAENEKLQAQKAAARAENEKLQAKIAAAEAQAEAAEAKAATVRAQQELEEERLKREELEERLRAAEARKQSALSTVKEAAHAPRPSSSDPKTRLEHNVSVELSRGALAADNFLKTGKWDWRGGKKKKKKAKK